VQVPWPKHHHVMSTTPAPNVPEMPRDGISPELQKTLDFISAENTRHQTYFQTLFDRTMKFLTLVVVILGGVGFFLASIR
jgi:hypothetical protein